MPLPSSYVTDDGRTCTFTFHHACPNQECEYRLIDNPNVDVFCSCGAMMRVSRIEGWHG